MAPMSVLYPIAASAEAALHAPVGFAARERNAEAVAGAAVHFVTEPVGPAFASEAAALDAYPGRLDDERPGRRAQVAPEARWCALRPVAPEGVRMKAQAPVNKDGRRWPARDPKAPGALWRLSVSYWRIGVAATASEPAGPARRLRRQASGETLDAAALRALARQPLREVRPQQPLDVGLFEARMPEAPDRLIPDE